MDSELNPEAPEFFPHLKKISQAGCEQISKVIKSSRNLPSGPSLDYYKTITDFNILKNNLTRGVIEQTNKILVTEPTTSGPLRYYDTEQSTQKILDGNDNMLDRVNINMDAVCGLNNTNGIISAPVISKVQLGYTTLIGAKNIPRPQFWFKDTIDNSENLWVPKIFDKPNSIKPLALNILYNEKGEAVGYEHPYKVELDLYEPPPHFIDPDPTPPVLPSPVQDTPFTYVATELELDALVEHLYAVQELAVDVEHHSYRTYQGITCLIQISTNEGGDFIVDTLAIREHIHKLNVIFTDPKKIKVFHGAENDVLWLQRDFGVYIVGLFDTYIAAKALNFPVLSLKSLLMRYCRFDADKKYQLADWRIRPLPEVLIAYARTDTHYLLYIWRAMKSELLKNAAGSPNLLLSVFSEGRQICGGTYNKVVVDETSHMPMYIRSKKTFTSKQLAALKVLYKWRDTEAREADESEAYLIPNHMLLKMAEELPREVQGVLALCKPVPPFIKQNLIRLHKIILSCRQLPDEPQLYEMPTSLRAMLNEPIYEYNCHDLTYFSDASDINFSPSNYLPITMVDTNVFYPDIQLFQQGKEIEVCPIISNLNAEAETFFPPYERYKKYRQLAQIEEMREFKEKEAKALAVGKDNELIKTEVIVKLQQAQNQIERESKEVLNNSVSDAEDSESSDVDKKSAQRKRKMASVKTDAKIDTEITNDKTKCDPETPKSTVNVIKTYVYSNKNNYKNFYDDSINVKENKIKQKKYKKK